MPLSAGDRLGPYEILAPIGAGGMGEVYRAHDPRVGRDVAIKVSKERLYETRTRDCGPQRNSGATPPGDSREGRSPAGGAIHAAWSGRAAEFAGPWATGALSGDV